ncbi:MAG: HAMP domain-containing histidine kinase [Deltaproteobacteria bacterium]|nr:HAMP domain-containing histidine kinase [Deltaproteobacteria bacterium]
MSNYPLEKGAPVTRWVHIFRDVTERRRLEAVAEAINVNEHLGFMVSALRHEFGNALNVAKLVASVLREDFESTLTPDMVVYVDRMNEQLGRMEYLLKLLRSYSFADVVSSEPINLCRVLMDFARLTSHDFSKRRVEVGLDLPLGVNALWVRGDPKALHQVLLNLVCNGAEAIPDDRAGRVVMRLAERGRDIVLEVEDDGVGIEAAKGSLFRPFFTTKPNGTGLGLVIVKRLLGAMGATIQLEAGPEGGAVARVTLPKADPAPAE